MSVFNPHTKSPVLQAQKKRMIRSVGIKSGEVQYITYGPDINVVKEEHTGDCFLMAGQTELAKEKGVRNLFKRYPQIAIPAETPIYIDNQEPLEFRYLDEFIKEEIYEKVS